MKAIINDISFQYTFFDEEDAFEKLHEFLYICKKIESNSVKNIESIVSVGIDPAVEMVRGIKIIKLLQKFESKDELRYLLGILINRPAKIDAVGAQFIIDGKASAVCALAISNVLVSVCSNEIFCDEMIHGKMENEEVKLRNVSKESHIYTYRKELGLRFYKANSKHKKDKENTYARNKVASRMDLENQEAQELLDNAILIKGKLYARKKGKNYAFQNERDVYYHGYIADDLGDDIIMELNKHKWN